MEKLSPIRLDRLKAAILGLFGAMLVMGCARGFTGGNRIVERDRHLFLKSQTCTRGRDSFSATWHGTDQLSFNLSSPPIPAQQELASLDARQTESMKPRVT